jgi:hypothetical protein
MHTIERTNGSAVTQNSNGDGVIPMPEEFAGLYQAGYEAGFASGRDAGFRQGYQAGFGDGRRQDDAGSAAAAAAVENGSENVAAMGKVRLFGLPCTKCRRLMFSDETRCPYCKAPRATLVEPPSATCCAPEEVRKREPDGGIEPPRILTTVKRIAESGLGRAVGTGLTGVYGGFDGNASATPPMAVRTEEK